jgi:deoxyribodipyrimidine photo-lyase
MMAIDDKRIFKKNEFRCDKSGDFVVYWMQIHHRLQYNFALQYAVELANSLDKPLLIYEELKCDYPWASNRIHTFYLEGMAEHADLAEEKSINWLPVIEKKPGDSRAIWERLFGHASALVTDDYPVYFIRDRNEMLGDELDIPVFTVDANGIIPLGMTEKAPYNAYFFRKIMQKNFIECYTNPPAEEPLDYLENTGPIDLYKYAIEAKKKSLQWLKDIPDFIETLDIRHDVDAIYLKGTREAAIDQLYQFIEKGLADYDEKRNDPDAKAASGLSPWLHFGKISEYEIVKIMLEHQPKGWDLDNITFNKGSTGGFFNGDVNVDAFLDEVITWREVGFHFAHHEPNYDKFETLPAWARETLEKHAKDEREYIYSFEELEQSETHDELWNAAQTQLRQEGVMQNYLRMLWGKKVMQWTPDPQTALDYLIELNNLYAIDGRDPNSYSGIFWCFGRFDRAWQERPIFGKTRYMTSNSARKKLKLKKYLEKYGNKEAGEM